MNSFKYRLEVINESMIWLLWPDTICQAQHQYIIACQKLINENLSESIDDCVVSFASLAIHVNFLVTSADKVANQLPNLLSKVEASSNSQSNLVKVPVYYGEDAGWDLMQVATDTKLSINKLIELHCQREYYAYATGFTPGFSYLGEVDKKLILPRKATPRLAMPKGAVSIAERQTAVYPNQSPGGWHILGQTPTPMYHIENNDFTPYINIGDRVQFYPISRNEFLALGGEVTLER